VSLRRRELHHNADPTAATSPVTLSPPTELPPPLDDEKENVESKNKASKNRSTLELKLVRLFNLGVLPRYLPDDKDLN